MSDSKTNDLISLENWREDFIRTIVMETIKLIAEEEKKLGPGYGGHLLSSFLASYIGALVFQALKKNKSFESSQFINVKSLVQESVSAGFTGAVSQATGTSQEYFCQVKAIPPPPSKAVN